MLMARYALPLAAALALAATGIAPVAPPGLGGAKMARRRLGGDNCGFDDMETMMKLGSWCIPRTFN
jgi:hypothetical protein